MSESNKVPIQATPEQQASMAASGLVGSLFTPGAAAGTHGSSQGHGTAPTSVPPFGHVLAQNDHFSLILAKR